MRKSRNLRGSTSIRTDVIKLLKMTHKAQRSTCCLWYGVVFFNLTIPLHHQGRKLLKNKQTGKLSKFRMSPALKPMQFWNQLRCKPSLTKLLVSNPHLTSGWGQDPDQVDHWLEIKTSKSVISQISQDHKARICC